MPNLYVGEGGGAVVIPRPPSPVQYNPGPPPRGSYAGTRSTSPGRPSPPPRPPPDIFANYPGPETDAAKQLVQQFLAEMGYPPGTDANQLTLQLLQSNLVADQQAAAMYLFQHGQGVSDDMRTAHPGAAFGLDAATYTNRRDSLDTLFRSLIAQTPDGPIQAGGDDLHNLYFQAFRGNWSQSQILQRLQGDPAFAQLRQAQPWLAVGQGEQQAAQQFASLYGSAPVDTNALAGWFRFNTGTQQLNRTGREAIMTAAPQPSTSEAR